MTSTHLKIIAATSGSMVLHKCTDVCKYVCCCGEYLLQISHCNVF